jgi:hypothetical protein
MRASWFMLAAATLVGAPLAEAQDVCRDWSGTSEAAESGDRTTGKAHFRVGDSTAIADVELIQLEDPSFNQDGTVSVALEQRFSFPDGSGFVAVLRSSLTPNGDGSYSLTGDAAIEAARGALSRSTGSLRFTGTVALSPFSSNLTSDGRICEGGQS